MKILERVCSLAKALADREFTVYLLVTLAQ